METIIITKKLWGHVWQRGHFHQHSYELSQTAL